MSTVKTQSFYLVLFAYLSCLTSISSQATSEIVKFDTISVSRCADRTTLFFLPDGYQESEYEDFYSLAVRTTKEIQRLYPHLTFEILAGRTYSKDSGILHPGTCANEVDSSDCSYIPVHIVDTYFATNLDGISDNCEEVSNDCSHGSHDDIEVACHRLVPLIERYFPDAFDNRRYYIPFFILNTDFFKTCGDYYRGGKASFRGRNSMDHIIISELKREEDLDFVPIHEMGHYIFDLADVNEWNYTKREKPNITQETRREHIKWKEFIDDDTPIPTPLTAEYEGKIGLFPIIDHFTGKETGWYRPSLNCIMRWNNQETLEFCKVCQNEIIKRGDNCDFVYGKVNNGKYTGYFIPNTTERFREQNPNPSTLVFDQWVGKGIVIDDPKNTTIDVTIPDSNFELTAQYKERTTSTEDINDDQITIYPNPSTTHFYIDGLEHSKNVQIRDISGKVVSNHQNTNKVPLNGLPTGVYIVQIRAKNKVFTQKLIKL